jgi:hypothetical protein
MTSLATRSRILKGFAVSHVLSPTLKVSRSGAFDDLMLLLLYAQMMVTVCGVTMHSGDTSQSDDENKLHFIVSCEGRKL